MNSKLLHALALLCLGGMGLADAGDLVPFAPPWDDTTPSATNLSATLPRPAGKFGHVRVRDGHLVAGDQRLRLFGVNMTAAGCFPDHATADKMAARMAKFGLNAVRFHFLDATWGQPRLLNYESGSWSNWNADALDRLDYFISRLREAGIYADLNLLVGRRFGVGDGVDPVINTLDWKAAHAVGFFHQPHLEAQKQYARQLLTHRNPYTKLTYAGDPAVALVEINNENGLLHTWMAGDFAVLPPPFGPDLQAQWNRWLAAKYPTTAALATAWGARDEPLGVEMLANADFAGGLEGWYVEQHEGAVVNARTENGSAILQVAETGTLSWHVQFNQPRLKLVKSGVYTLSFRAAAEKPRQLEVTVMQAHAPWQLLGFTKVLDLDKQPRTFSFTFTATADDDNARVGFTGMNQPGAEFRFAALSLKAGGRLGLGPDETLETRTIRMPLTPAVSALPPGEKADVVRFLWETERHYWREMRRFLREDLGVKALVAGTTANTSTPALMAEFDVVDTHAYWEHPNFPGKPWDRNNWTVMNLSMVDYPERATVTRLAFQRVLGKPHMVSEYNHPAPNTHAGEGPLFIATYAGLQDWDALFLYTYAHDEERVKAGRIPDFFDIGQHPTIMANVPLASLLFRRGDVTPARELVSIPLPETRELELISTRGHNWGVAATDQLGFDLQDAVRHRIALDLSAKAGTNPRHLDTAGRQELRSDTGEVSWRVPVRDQGVFTLRTPRMKAVLGHIDGQTIPLGDAVSVSVKQTRTGWCTVALTLLEGDSFARGPARILVAATGCTENTGMGWKNAEKSTVGSDWGKAPSLVEAVNVTLRLPRGPALPRVQPLNERGERGASEPAARVNGDAVEIQLNSPTLWYEILLPAAE